MILVSDIGQLPDTEPIPVLSLTLEKSNFISGYTHTRPKGLYSATRWPGTGITASSVFPVRMGMVTDLLILLLLLILLIDPVFYQFLIDTFKAIILNQFHSMNCFFPQNKLSTNYYFKAR